MTHPSMEDLFSYPLMSALTERRTRRIPRGFSVNAGPLTHESHNDPAPLSPLEEAILVTCITGIVGKTTHDGPLTKANGKPELGTPFLNVLARTGSSADNCQATHFFMINDDGIFLLKHPTGSAALEALNARPRDWGQWSDQDWLSYAEQCKVRISDKRLEFPREWPYYLGWNAQASNVAGTTLFYPVIDCTWQYINALLIIANEPDGKRSMFMDDWRPFHPKGFVEWMAKGAGMVRPSMKIPYQPIGGLKYVRNKFVNKDNVVPLGFGHTLRTDYESFFYFQNLMLLGQAMGLGGWIHGAVFTPYIWQKEPAKDWHGLGFRMEQPKTLKPWAPVPASQPNPVGIDGVLEGLTPPYVKSMDEAVDKVMEMKYGADGVGVRQRGRLVGSRTGTRRTRRRTCGRAPRSATSRSSTSRTPATTCTRPTAASRPTSTRSTPAACGSSSPTWRWSTTTASSTPRSTRGRPPTTASGTRRRTSPGLDAVAALALPSVVEPASVSERCRDPYRYSVKYAATSSACSVT